MQLLNRGELTERDSTDRTKISVRNHHGNDRMHYRSRHDLR